MKNTIKLLPLTAIATIAATTAHAATTITNTLNVNTFLTDGTNVSGQTDDVVFDAGGGTTLTFRITSTTANGQNFNSLDGGDRVSVAGTDGNHFEAGEDITFSVEYLSHTGAIDLSSIAFGVNQIGLRNSDATENTYTWSSTATPSFTFDNQIGENYRTLDGSNTAVIGDTGTYIGTLGKPITANTSQLTTFIEGGGDKGLQFTAVFAVPEPSSAALLALGGLSLITRRKRSNA